MPVQKARQNPAPTEMSRANAAMIAELCAAAEAPTMAATLIREGVTVAEARTRLDVVGQIKSMVDLVKGRPGITASLTTQALAGRLTLAQVRATMIGAMAAADEAIHIDAFKLTGDGQTNGAAASKRSMVALVEKSGMKPVKS